MRTCRLKLFTVACATQHYEFPASEGRWAEREALLKIGPGHTPRLFVARNLQRDDSDWSVHAINLKCSGRDRRLAWRNCIKVDDARHMLANAQMVAVRVKCLPGLLLPGTRRKCTRWMMWKKKIMIPANIAGKRAACERHLHCG